jgi:hypothetical protein
MAYSLSPSTSQVKVPPYIQSTDTNYIETFAAVELDTTSRAVTPAIDTIGLYSLALHFHNNGANALTAVTIYGAKDLSAGNVTNTVDVSGTTYFAVTTTLATLASASKSYAVWKFPGTLPRYIQVYAAAADANKTNLQVTVIATYLA